MTEEEWEEDTIRCKRLGDDPDAWTTEARDASTRLPNVTSESWIDDKDRVGDSDDKWVECILQVINHIYILGNDYIKDIQAMSVLSI
jgi:hypothetical protein